MSEFTSKKVPVNPELFFGFLEVDRELRPWLNLNLHGAANNSIRQGTQVFSSHNGE